MPKKKDNNKRKPKIKKKNKAGDAIAKSRQLTEKIKTVRTSRGSRRSNTDRVCGNGTIMPSLEELERMYEDSDSDTVENPTSPSQAPVEASPERPATPTEQKPIVITEDKLSSPTTIKLIASRVMEYLDKVPLIVLDDDDGPRPPVIKQRKRKNNNNNKSSTKNEPNNNDDLCTSDLLQPPRKRKATFLKGGTTYGVNPNACPSDDDEPVSSDCVHFTKSIFNPLSGEIADRLKEKDAIGSPDSDETVDYECTQRSPVLSSHKTSPIQNTRSFSPLPSTSRDNETILKNDERFNESLKPEILITDNSQDDVRIIEAPIDTIILDDSGFVTNVSAVASNTRNKYDIDDDCCVIVQSSSEETRRNVSPVQLDNNDDMYASIDLTSFNTVVDEIIDVDDVIAENNAILQKYKGYDESNSIILVEPSTSTNNPQNISNNNTHIPKPISESIIQDSNNHEDLPNIIVSPNPPSTSQSTAERNPVNSPILQIQNRSRPPIATLPHQFNNTLPTSHQSALQSLISNIRYEPNQGHLGSNRQSQARSGRFYLSNDNAVQAHISQRANHNDRTFENVPPVSSQTVTNPERQMNTSQSAESNKNIGDCPICMDSLSKAAVASTLCGHLFCMDCIKAAIRANGKRCPTCRKVLKGTGGGYHQIFL